MGQDGTGWGRGQDGTAGKGEESLVSGKVILAQGEEWVGLTMWVTSFAFGEKEKPLEQVSSLMWTRKFLTNLVSLQLEGRLELQSA